MINLKTITQANKIIEAYFIFFKKGRKLEKGNLWKAKY